MMKTFSQGEMLAEWRKALGLHPLNTDATIEVFESLDTDSVLLRAMRAWYLNLLATAPPAQLPVSNVASRCSLKPRGQLSAIVLPADAVRVVSVKLDSWQRPAFPVSGEALEKRLSRMASPYGQPGDCDPLLFIDSDAPLIAPADGRQLEQVMAVTDPGADLYILDPHLLSTIPTDILP